MPKNVPTKNHNKQTPSQIKKTAGQYLCVNKASDADQQAFTLSLYSITLFTQIYQFCDNQRENSQKIFDLLKNTQNFPCPMTRSCAMPEKDV